MHKINPETVEELRTMSGYRLSTLRWTSGFLMVFPILCTAALGFVIYKRLTVQPHLVHKLLDWQFFYFFVGLTVLGIIGSITRTYLGWSFLIIMGLGFILLFPLGLAVTLICFNFVITGMRLFGPRRFTGTQLIAEFDYRVAKFGYDDDSIA